MSTAASGGQMKKKHFAVPHSFIIILLIILFAVILTWILPAGAYVRVENAQGIEVVDPTQFSYIDRTPVNPFLIPLYIVNAFIKKADLIFCILFVGGAFYTLTSTGALQSFVAIFARKFEGKTKVFIPAMMLVFALICTVESVNMFIAFSPVLVSMALAMGFDSIVGVGILLLGGAVGFSTGTLNTSTTIVAQQIAELPLYSGIGYRWVCFAVYYVVTAIMLTRYALEVKKNPQASPMYELDRQNPIRSTSLDDFGTMNGRKWACLAAFTGYMILNVVGGINWGWGMKNFAATAIYNAITIGLIAGYHPNDIARKFSEGCKTMMNAAIIIGMAQAIALILADGNIIDTIIHALAGGLTAVPSWLQAPAMFLANILVNVFITSGSGQAAAVMPLFIPLADLIGMTRQTAILCFNFGDGFCNYILPTSTALMGNLSACNVPYDKWMKFFWKRFLIWVLTGCVLVSIANMIGYGPM